MSKRGKAWLIGIFSFFVILFISLRLIIFFWLNPLVDKILKESVRIYSDELYQVNYDDLRIKPLERRLTLENFRLYFDTTRLENDTSSHKNILVKAEADHVEVAIGNLSDLLFNRYLLIRQIYLQEPSVAVYHYADSVSQPEKPFDAYALVKDYFDSVHVQLIEIREAGFSLNNISATPFQEFSLDRINAFVNNMVIDSGTVYRNFGYPKAEKFELLVKETSYSLPDSLYDISIGEAAFYPVLEFVVLKDVRLNPKLKKRQMARTLGFQKDWMEGSVAEIRLQDVSLHQFIVNNIVNVSMVILDSASLHVYKDKGVEKRHEIRPMLSDALHQVKVPFKLDTIMLKNSSIRYEEKVPSSTQAGQISFTRLFASIYHTSNIDSVNRRSAMEADVRAYLMGESLLKVSFDFPLDNPRNWHRVKGRLENMPLEVMNQMLEPVAFTSVQSGVSQLLEFEMEVDSEKATGQVNFLYTDLKIEMLNQKDPEDDPKLKHKLGSVITNLFVLKKDNPTGTQPLRKGVISFSRDKEKSIFGYWWHSLLSGLKISVGIESEPEQVPEADGEANVFEAQEEKRGLLKRLWKGKKN